MDKKKNILIRQIIVWLGIFVMFFNMANHFQPIRYALLSGLSDTLALFVTYQVSVRFLFRRFYGNQRKFVYMSIFALLGLSLVFYLLDSNFVPRIENPAHPSPPEVFHFMRVFIGNTFMFFIATSVSLMEHNNRLKENEKMLTEEKLETELKLLKAQINPHFIFNALNNIYALTYMKANNAPDSVLKLSEMLRYVFYDCNKDKVPVSAEITYIENFIAFQQMKSEKPQAISFEKDPGIHHFQIAPMLFIPFIENSFKYSRIEEEQDAYVNVSLSSEGEELTLEISNSVAVNKPQSGSGMGLKNVKHRLELLYPNKHTLDINESADKHDVKLTIHV